MKDFSSMPDEAVIELIRSGGNKEAEEYILKKYNALVVKLSHNTFIVGSENEDVIQEGMIGLYKAMRDYRPDKNTKFYSFARLCIERQIATAIKLAGRQKHKPLNESLSLDKNPFDEDGDMSYLELFNRGSATSPESIVIDSESKQDLEERIKAKLSSLEKQVLILYLRGMNYTQIAKYIEKDEKSIDNTLQRIKKKVSRIVDTRRG